MFDTRSGFWLMASIVITAFLATVGVILFAPDTELFAQGPLFVFETTLTGEQWANIAVTGVIWLVVPLAVGLGFVTRVEVK